MSHAVGMIEMGLGAGTFIYRIDDNPNEGEVVPNLGTGGYDFTVQAETAPGFTHYRVARPPAEIIPQEAFGSWDLPWTILFRVGAFPQTAPPAGIFNVTRSYATLTKFFDPAFIHQQLSYTTENVPDYSRFFTGVARFFQLDQPTPDVLVQNCSYMVTFTPAGVWRIVITTDGGTSFSTIQTGTGTVQQAATLWPIIFRAAQQTAPVLYDWSESVNGLAWWRELCTTDSDFRALYNEFINA